MTEIKKVVIPKFIAEAMQGYDSLEMMLGEEYYSNSSEEIGNDDIQCWIDENFETLCRAWLDGYELKKQKLYRVAIPTDFDPQFKYYFIGFVSNGIIPKFDFLKEYALKIDDFKKAKAVAYLITGNVEEVEVEQ